MINLKNSGQGLVMMFIPVETSPSGIKVVMRHKRKLSRSVSLFGSDAECLRDKIGFYHRRGFRIV